VNRNAALLKIAAIFAAVAALALFGFTGFRLLERFSAGANVPASSGPSAAKPPLPDLNGDTITIDGVTYTRKRRVESYLILGTDRTEEQIQSGSSAGQADVLLLLVTDAETDTFCVLAINRDTVTQVTVLSGNGEITDEKFEPICLSHSYGTGGTDSCKNTARSVSYLLSGIEPDGFFALDLRAIGVLNDAVGGVTVTIEKDLTAVDPSFREGATVKLDARTAEAYVRARMLAGEEDNFSRMERQTRYMKEWLRMARQLGERRLLELLDQIREIGVTDLTEKRLTSIASDLEKYENLGFLTIGGEYVETVSYNAFHADEDSVLETILKLYYTAEETNTGDRT